MTTRGRRRFGAHHGTLRGPVLPWAWAWAARSPGTGESFARGYQWDFSGGGRGVWADGAPTGARPRAKVSLQMRARRGRRPGGQCQLLRPPRPPLRPAGGHARQHISVQWASRGHRNGQCSELSQLRARGHSATGSHGGVGSADRASREGGAGTIPSSTTLAADCESKRELGLQA